MKSLKKKEAKPKATIHLDTHAHEVKVTTEGEEKPATEVKKTLNIDQENVRVAEVKVEEKSSLLIQIILPVIVGVVVGVVTGIGVFTLFNSRIQGPEKNVQPTPTQAIAAEEATESAKMNEGDLSLYDIKVLNGSGKAGEAGKLEKTLKDKGFSVLEIGNADRSDYTKTKIQAKEKVPADFLSKLESTLKELFDVDKKEDLGKDEDVDVIITVGSSSKSEISPTPTDKP